MLKILSRIVDHENESLIFKVTFHNEAYRNRFMSGRYAYMDMRVGLLLVKTILCHYNPFNSIHIAKKVENMKPLTLALSRNRSDQQYITLISRTNNWYFMWFRVKMWPHKNVVNLKNESFKC